MLIRQVTFKQKDFKNALESSSYEDVKLLDMAKPWLYQNIHDNFMTSWYAASQCWSGASLVWADTLTCNILVTEINPMEHHASRANISRRKQPTIPANAYQTDQCHTVNDVH